MSPFSLARSFLEWRVARFIISGGTSAATNLLLLFILTHWYGVWYVYSSVIAVSVATIVSFILQKLWTFKNFSLAVHTQFPLHVTLGLVNIVVNTGILYVLVEYFHIWYLIAQIISGILLAFVNYFTYKTYIFRNEARGI
jgi:dolichol-phosphate mannosyltransferase